MTTIKDQSSVNILIGKGWHWNQDQEVNPGQLDAPDGISWYDAARGEFHIEDEGKVICESCLDIYDYVDEPAEVKEGGTHICPECWAKPE